MPPSQMGIRHMKTPLTFRPLAIALTCLVALLAAVSTGFAQTNRSEIEGRVADGSGAVLPGVTVTITSPALLSPLLSTVSEADGRYRFSGLPPGTFAITATLQGFDTVKRENIRLTTGFVATIDLVLTVGSISESITVSAAGPIVDIRSTSVSATFTREALEAVPTARQIWQIMDLSPGVRMRSAVPDVGGSTAGLQQRYVTYGSGRGGNRPTLEGVDMHEQTEAGPFYFDYGAFEEMQVKAMANDAEVPVAGMNLIAVVKSGGNAFHGGGLYQVQRPEFQSRNIDADQRANGLTGNNKLHDYHDIGVDLGGRVVRDRLWFFGAIRDMYNGSEKAGYSLAKGADGVYGTSDDPPGLGEVMQTVYTAKVTGQVRQNHNVIGFYSRSEKENPASNGGPFVPLEATYTQNFNNNAAKGEWNWVASPRAVVTVFVGRNWWRNMGTNYSTADSTFDTVTQWWGGAGVNRTSGVPFNYSPSRKRTQYATSYSYFIPNGAMGSHQLKAGIEYVDELYQTETFSRPNRNDFLLQFANGVPFQVLLFNTPYSGRADMTTFSTFVKDSWRISERLTANIGLRADRYVSFIPAQTKVAGRFSQQLDIPKTDVSSWFAVVPRIGLAYALRADGKTAIKVSYGRFGFLQSTDYAKAYNANDQIVTTYRWSDPDGDRTFREGEEGTFVNRTGASSAVINPDVKQPKVDEVTATIEHELISNLSVRASYIFKRESDLYQKVSLSRPFSSYNIPISSRDPGPDGVANTADDGAAITYFDYDPSLRGAAFSFETDQNTPGNRDQFSNYEVAVTRRLSGRWQMMGSFLATNRDVWRSGIPQNPNVANFFPKDQTWEYNTKLSGSYRLPFDIQAAGSYTRVSGTPWAREARFTTGLQQLTQVIALMEPFGARMTPTINLTTLRLEKRVKVRGTEGSVQFDVFNAFNTNAETSFNARSGPTFGRITGSVPPRVARLGFSLRF